jgi:hypothetical protein
MEESIVMIFMHWRRLSVCLSGVEGAKWESRVCMPFEVKKCGEY